MRKCKSIHSFLLIMLAITLIFLWKYNHSDFKFWLKALIFLNHKYKWWMLYENTSDLWLVMIATVSLILLWLKSGIFFHSPWNWVSLWLLWCKKYSGRGDIAFTEIWIAFKRSTSFPLVLSCPVVTSQKYDRSIRKPSWSGAGTTW